MNIFAQSLTRIRATRTRDDSGTLTPQSDWSAAVETELAGLSIQPAKPEESRDDAGIQATEDWSVFSRPGVVLDLRIGDRARWQDVVYDVVGAPQAWAGHHSEFRLTKPPLTRLDATGTAGVLRQGLRGAANAQEPYTP